MMRYMRAPEPKMHFSMSLFTLGKWADGGMHDHIGRRIPPLQRGQLLSGTTQVYGRRSSAV